MTFSKRRGVTEKFAIPGTVILQGVLGSRAHGFATPDSDYDHMGVFTYPLHQRLGLQRLPETLHETGETDDWTVHEVGRFLQLCLRMSIHAFPLLWVDTHEVVTDAGRMLLNNRRAFLSSTQALFTYVGYLTENKTTVTSLIRAESPRAPKALRNLLRLSEQGVTVLEDGYYPVKVADPKAMERRVAYYLNHPDAVVPAMDANVARMVTASTASRLPNEPNTILAERLAYEIRKEAR